MASPSDLPTLIQVQVVAYPGLESQLGFRIKQGEEGAILIYYIEPDSATAKTELCVGCEILSINDHRVASTKKAEEMLTYYMEKRGAVDIMVSKGGRPRGTRYVLMKNAADKSIFTGDLNDIDGLKLEEKQGYIRIAETPATGFFSKAHLNKGDCIWNINGNPVRDLDDMHRELMQSTGKILVMLTYNSFRKLKTTVMSTSACEFDAGGKRYVVSIGKTAKLEDTYTINEKLGEGAFAVVKKATHKDTGRVYAIKTVNRSSLGSEIESSLKDEIAILTELNHEHIMNLHKVFVTLNEYHLVTEYLEGGELFDRIVEKSSYTESEARDVCKILFDALSYMELKRIAHRDLKPENLLLQYKHSDSEIKIADFGFAKKAETEESLATICGTPGYVGPEVLSKRKYGTKCDMWSMGVIVYILLGGYPPFYADNERELFRLTRTGEFEFHEEHWAHVSDGAKNLISSLLLTNPTERASAQDVLSHPWMKEDSTTLKKKSLANSQAALKRHIARTRFKKAIHSVIFVTGFAGEHAIFSGKKKRALKVED